MLLSEVYSLPESTIFICKRCRTFYWKVITPGEIFCKKKSEVALCQSCKRSNIFYYDSISALSSDINHHINILLKKQSKQNDRAIQDLEKLKEQLIYISKKRGIIK